MNPGIPCDAKTQASLVRAVHARHYESARFFDASAWSDMHCRALLSSPTGSVIALPEEPRARATAQPFFRGAVCVLIGPGTFSSAADIADAIKTYRLATLVGEETGGRGNTFGEAYPFRLPHSSLLIFASTARYVRANGDTSDDHGVVPDISVTSTAADLRAGRDPALDRAMACR